MMAKFVPLTFLKDTASIVAFCQDCCVEIFKKVWYNTFVQNDKSQGV